MYYVDETYIYHISIHAYTNNNMEKYADGRKMKEKKTAANWRVMPLTDFNIYLPLNLDSISYVSSKRFIRINHDSLDKLWSHTIAVRSELNPCKEPANNGNLFAFKTNI